MKKISTWHIHIKGQVQGVGFRPFVYQLAKKFNLSGWVNNNRDGVHIGFNANKIVSERFYDELVSNPPQFSHITSHCIKKISSEVYRDFKILSSSNGDKPITLLSPDLSICTQCSKEVANKTNLRYEYAFTTCTQCGPRYSIIKQLPYDRENTAMDDFEMCSRCYAEYTDPMNRRHFSQTNSCSLCPVVMKLYDNRQKIIEDEPSNILNRICEYWSNGHIVAIKGIGGYLLTCDASNPNVIDELRRRKHRPSKPFALMFPDMLSLSMEVQLSEAAITALESVAAPIVLLQLKNKMTSATAIQQIAPELSTIGVMLPYTPLYQLLLQQYANPIVATSGNLSNAPIVYNDEVALNELKPLADYLLVSNREIIISQDDSVVKFSPHAQQRIMLRRARGFAPLYSTKHLSLPQTTVLATGALLKSSFSLLHAQNIHVSQYLGDTDNYDVQKNFEKTLHHFLRLFHAQPEIILVDKHPDYFTSQLGEQLAITWSSRLIRVQHHEAHFASVLGEHNLLNEAEPILGVIWDGAGLGDDNQIWGGEFFTYHHQCISRAAHFDYFNYFLGDKMAYESRLSAFSLCYEMEEAVSILQPRFAANEWSLYQKLIGLNKLKTSSVGRIFDGVASLLGLIDKQSYQGQAAMLLEENALSFFKAALKIPAAWLENGVAEHYLSTRSLMKEIIRKIKEGKDLPEIAAWFHVQLVWQYDR
ncbi:MAG: carbamoyltransferase HypF [Chitinophagaceae bacterium]